MRALCGAIISAGAMIGLGLLAIGIGNRYYAYPSHDMEGKIQWYHLKDLDTPLLLTLVVLLIALGIGLTVAFIGLAYHHHRRHLEMHGRTPAERSSSHQITV
jgi:multisubunit Na+/H+ antiporter MnhB subunit